MLFLKAENHSLFNVKFSFFLSLVAKYSEVVDSHATSNPVISDVKREKKKTD